MSIRVGLRAMARILAAIERIVKEISTLEGDLNLCAWANEKLTAALQTVITLSITTIFLDAAPVNVAPTLYSVQNPLNVASPSSIYSLSKEGTLVSYDFEADPSGEWSLNYNIARSTDQAHGGSYSGKVLATKRGHARWDPATTRSGTHFKIEGWFYRTADGDMAIIYACPQNASDICRYAYVIWLSTGIRLRYWSTVQGGEKNVNETTEISNNTWHKITLEWKSATFIKVWVDDFLRITVTDVLDIAMFSSGWGDVWWGRYYHDVGPDTAGDIYTDDVSVIEKVVA